MSSDRATRWLFTAIALTMIALGLAAVLLESHTGVTRRGQTVSFEGKEAVWMGETLMLLGVMPLGAWVPRRYLLWFMNAWGVGFVVWVFAGVFSR